MAAGIDYICLGRQRRARAMPPRQAGLNVADPATHRLVAHHRLVISPGIPSTFPKPHPVAAAARAAGKPIICDVELLARAQARGAVRRHHRHQRQVDDDGADRPYPHRGRRALRGRRQYRPRRARPGAAGRGRPLRAGAVVLPARTAADLPRPCRGVAQHHARPYRPPWRSRGLCRRQGEHLRPPAGPRLRRDRRRRRSRRAPSMPSWSSAASRPCR